MHKVCFFINILIVFSATISLSVDRIRLSASSLIVAECAIRKQKSGRVHPSPYILFFVVTSSCCHNCEVTIWKSARCVRDNSVTTKNEMGFVVTLLNICLPICVILCDNVTTKNEFFSGRREEGGTLTACSVTLLPAYSLVLFLSLLFRRGWNCRFLGLKNWADNFLFYSLIL